MARREGRTQPCGRKEARVRLRQAEAFLLAAELVVDDPTEVANAGVASALAVLAGIAAADAACCSQLHRRSRGADHRRAVDLIGSLQPNGPQLATSLDRLLAVKDEAQYGLTYVGDATGRRMLRAAHALVEGCTAIVERR